MIMLKQHVEEYERNRIIDALKECNCVMSRAARMLGITEKMIGHRIRKYGIKRDMVFSLGSGR